eukprot:405025_1
MQPSSATYSTIGSKRRKLSPPEPLCMIRASSAPTDPQGWWIGLTINVNKHSLKLNQNNSELPSTITATIHDYDTKTGESQLWMNHNNTYLMDTINLHSNPPPYVTVTGNIWDNPTVSIPPYHEWIPMKLEIGCLVKIIHHEMEGIIDAYDPRSRRYHITYHKHGMSEWLWCTNHNTKVCTNTQCVPVPPRTTITAPPFDLKPYGLDPAFLDLSSTLSMDNKDAPLLPAPATIRIPKMTEKVTSPPNDREIITISSSPSPTKKSREVIDLLNDEEEILIGTVQHRQYNRDLMRREKEKRRKRKKERRKHRKRKGSSKYPRKMKINGVKWKRKYTADEKRYYWVQKNNAAKSSWNPFQDAGQIAPWLKGRSHWQQWMDQD